MKPFHVILAIALLVGSSHAAPEERVKEIRNWYGKIQEAEPAKTTAIKFDLEDDPFSGEATIREYADGLKAIAVSYTSGDHGGADEFYYYKHGELFFVFEKESSWQFEGGTAAQPATVDFLTENRYYYDGNVCVRQLSRTAKSASAEKLKAVIAKVEQSSVKPGESAAEMRTRGMALLKADSAATILKAYDL